MMFTDQHELKQKPKQIRHVSWLYVEETVIDRTQPPVAPNQLPLQHQQNQATIAATTQQSSDNVLATPEQNPSAVPASAQRNQPIVVPASSPLASNPPENIKEKTTSTDPLTIVAKLNSPFSILPSQPPVQIQQNQAAVPVSPQQSPVIVPAATQQNQAIISDSPQRNSSVVQTSHLSAVNPVENIIYKSSSTDPFAIAAEVNSLSDQPPLQVQQNQVITQALAQQNSAVVSASTRQNQGIIQGSSEQNSCIIVAFAPLPALPPLVSNSIENNTDKSSSTDPPANTAQQNSSPTVVPSQSLLQSQSNPAVAPTSSQQSPANVPG